MSFRLISLLLQVMMAGGVAVQLAAGNLTLGSSVKVKALVLKVGHMDLRMTGDLAPFQLEGQSAGQWYFKGVAEFTYTSEDACEQPLIRTNLKGCPLTGTMSSKGTTFRAVFRQMYLAWAGPGFPTLPEERGADLGADFKELHERWGPYEPFPLQLSAMLAAGALSEPVVTIVGTGCDIPAEYAKDDRSGVEFREGNRFKTPLIYQFDPVHAHEESLMDRHDGPFARPEVYGFRTRVLSCMPIGRTRAELPKPHVTLTHVDVDLTDLGHRKARLLVKETLVPGVSGLRSLRLGLNSHRSYPQGPADPYKAHWHVRKAEDAQGRALAFAHEGGELLIALPQPTQAGVPIEARFEIEGDFLVQPNLDSYWELGTENWFPCPGLEGQNMTSHAVVRARKPWTACPSGEQVRRWEEGEFNVVETRFEKPIAFPVILAGNYHTKEESRNGLTVRVSTYAFKNDRAAAQMIHNAFSYLEFYSRLLGAYPFKEFHILEKNALGYGQAPAGIMFLTKEAFNFNRLDEWQKLYTQGLNARFAHEIAHQWWGTLVKMPTLEEQWITETFAEYCAALSRKFAVGNDEFVKQAAPWILRAKQADPVPIPLANLYYHPEYRQIFQTRTGLLYNKGPVILMDLHREMGDQAFLTFLRSYQTNFKWKFGSTKSVVSFLNFLTKKDYTDYFDRYFWGTETPNVKAAYPGVNP